MRGFVLLTASSAVLCVGAAIVTPKITDDVLVNPGMGIVHYCYSSRIWAYGAQQEPGDVLDWMPGTSVIYMRLPWCYLEPEEGAFRWDIIESRARSWIAAGKKIAFRISCMDPTLVSIPDWAIRAGIKGQTYHYRDKPGNALVFEPNWDDPVFLEKVSAFYRAFAARYDGNPDVAFVDLGSFGMYGEGHGKVLDEIRERDPAEFDRLCRLHLTLLRNALPNTYLVVSDDIGGGGWLEVEESSWLGTEANGFVQGGKPRLYDHPLLTYARSIGYGLRDDSIMCNPKYPWNSDHFGRLFARESPVVIETGHISKRIQTKSWKPEYLRKCIEDYHASYISSHGFPDLYWEKNKQVWSEFANRLGYRFELRKVEYPDVVKVSDPVEIRSVWVNVGVALEYANSSLTWNLLNDKGVVCWSTTDSRFGFRSLEPKWEGVEKPVAVASQCAFGFAAEVPNNGNDVILSWCVDNGRNDPGSKVELLKPGTYTLAVSVGRNDGKPLVALPLAGGRGRIYPVGPIIVRE